MRYTRVGVLSEYGKYQNKYGERLADTLTQAHASVGVESVSVSTTQAVFPISIAAPMR